MVGSDRAQQAMQGYGYQVNVFPPPQLPDRPVEAVSRGEARAPTGALPEIWNVEARNPGFCGRDTEMAALRERLQLPGPAVVQALHGIGGVGKTQLAVEYAYRNHEDYDLVWWLSAEQPELIGEQYAALGTELGLAGRFGDSTAVARLVKAHLRTHDRWLVVFDNAESPADIRNWLPSGPGHVVITSRHPMWGQLAQPFEVDVLRRSESVELLTAHYPALSATDADRLADALGDLPLGLGQAAGFLAETGTSPAEYLQLLKDHADEVLAEGRPLTYPHSFRATIKISADKLAAVDPAALAVLSFCAFLAPEPVPLELLTVSPPDRMTSGSRTPVPLAPLNAIRKKPVALRRSIGRISNFGLARVSPDGISLHRLTQTVLRDELNASVARQVRERVEAALAATNPGDPDQPATWPRWAVVMPHLLAIDVTSSGDPFLRDLACDAAWYLLARGDPSSGQQLAEHLLQHWRESLGSDDTHTLRAASTLARAWLDLGRPESAAQLDHDTLARRRRLLGEDHADTLRSASNLALALRAAGNVQQALQLDRNTFARRQRLLGEEHPDSLRSANNLALTMTAAGDVRHARALLEENAERARRVLGDRDPYTLTTANYLAYVLVTMGDLGPALSLTGDILARRRALLGECHPNTLHSANDHARVLYQLGEFEQARVLDVDTLARRRRTLGDDHPDTLISADNLELDLLALCQPLDTSGTNELQA
jgi:hypothetical protein